MLTAVLALATSTFAGKPMITICTTYSQGYRILSFAIISVCMSVLLFYSIFLVISLKPQATAFYSDQRFVLCKRIVFADLRVHFATNRPKFVCKLRASCGLASPSCANCRDRYGLECSHRSHFLTIGYLTRVHVRSEAKGYLYAPMSYFILTAWVT